MVHSLSEEFVGSRGVRSRAFAARAAGPLFKSHARGRVFKRGELIGRRISAGSKSSSVIDKNRGGGGADMPAIHREDPRQNLLRKNHDRRKGAPISVPSKAGEGEFGPS
jgi:hypothetical protein